MLQEDVIPPVLYRPFPQPEPRPLETPSEEWRLSCLKKFGAGSFSSVLLYPDFACYRLTRSEGFIGYLDMPGMAMAIGDPVCDPADYLKAGEEFLAFAAGRGQSCLFVIARPEFREAMRPLAMSWVSLGEDLIFEVPDYAPRGDAAKKVRSARNQLLKRGGRVFEYRPEQGNLEQAINEMAQRWLTTHPFGQLSLATLDLFRFAPIKRYFVAEVGGTIQAVLSALPIYARQGYLLEDLIREPDASNGCSELLILEALRIFREEGRQIATLGLSPRVRISREGNFSGWSVGLIRAGYWVANRLSSLDELYHYRKKFHPQRAEPNYLLKYPAGIGLHDFWGIIQGFRRQVGWGARKEK